MSENTTGTGQGARPRALVVGILNLTPDSFSDGGRYQQLDQAVARVEQMLAQGADWIDIGGESTRPGAATISVDEECRRVLPVVQAVADLCPISIDTRKAAVAAAALRAGARIINDVSGLDDPEMAAVSADAEATVVMHMRGQPDSMRGLTDYDDVAVDVRDHLLERAARVRSPQVWLDPGIGFAKTAAQSLELLRRLELLVDTGLPVYVGASRKSFIGATLGLPAADQRLAGSLAAAGWAWLKGAQALRVHDVDATRQHLDMLRAIAQPAPDRARGAA